MFVGVHHQPFADSPDCLPSLNSAQSLLSGAPAEAIASLFCRFVVLTFCRSVGLSVSWSVALLVGCSVGPSVGRSVYRFVGLSVCSSVVLLVPQSVLVLCFLFLYRAPFFIILHVAFLLNADLLYEFPRWKPG